ncbi:hypothetical protein NDU88_004117 [Pleurodeles waltl]|uniref:Uncharacterized protein n=1 Tax=Pleurodeles waltl TaxID=8319 RepID=A0AAV7T6K8_PLEWA|nr:hypothetical protein NDU88_004117 [Pleurodeles waltl]
MVGRAPPSLQPVHTAFHTFSVGCGVSFSPYLLLGPVLLQTPVLSGATPHQQHRSTLPPSRHLAHPGSELGCSVQRRAAAFSSGSHRTRCPGYSDPWTLLGIMLRDVMLTGFFGPAATAGSSALLVRLHQLQATPPVNAFLYGSGAIFY